MSYSLIFKKGEVEILSLGVNHPLATAFVNKPYDEWKQMSRLEFADAMKILELQDADKIEHIEMLTKMLEYSQDWEQRWDLLIAMNDTKKERKAIADAKVMVGMLEMIWEEGSHCDDQSNMGLYWAVL